jgi:hypothetical protein
MALRGATMGAASRRRARPSAPRRPAVARIAAVAAAGLLALPFIARPASAAQHPTATVGQIVANAAAYYGQAVTVTGDVEDTLGPRAFTLQDDDLLSNEAIAVVTARPIQDQAGRPLDLALLANRILWIAGTVHQFNLAAFEQRLGIDLDDARFAAWAGRPAVIADSIVTRPPTLDSRELAVDDLTANPFLYYGQTATVIGEVAAGLSPRSLVIEDNDLLFDEHLLVVSARPIIDRAGQPLDVKTLVDSEVQVTGTVRPFDRAEFARQIGFDLDARLFAEWEGKPAIIARSIRLLRPAPAR